MANFTTDGKICIERELIVPPTKFDNITQQFDLEKTCEWIKNNGFSKVCLQFPDDLLTVSVQIYEEIKERIDVDLYILGDTSYASCCIDTVAAMHVKADAVVHYGHTCFSKTNIPVYLVLPKAHCNPAQIIANIVAKFEGSDEQLSLFYGAEFDHCKDDLIKVWFQQYPESYVGYIEKEEHEKRFLGRLLKNISGDILSVDVIKDCTCIYVGSSGQTMFNFTISIAAKVWYLLDSETNVLQLMEETRWFKRRNYLVEKCRDANVIGVLVCKLAGDQTKNIINRMKQLCRINGKKNYIVSVGKPNVAKLANFPEIDLYVMIACPENDLYSNRDFYKPIVYPYELEVALNSKRDPYFTTHVTDYDDLLEGKRHHCNIEPVKETTDVSLITGKIRETKVENNAEDSRELEVKQNWALEHIGKNLQDKHWKGLEQKLGETDVKKAEEGRRGIPLQYKNEPE